MEVSKVLTAAEVEAFSLNEMNPQCREYFEIMRESHAELERENENYRDVTEDAIAMAKERFKPEDHVMTHCGQNTFLMVAFLNLEERIKELERENGRLAREFHQMDSMHEALREMCLAKSEEVNQLKRELNSVRESK